MIHGILFNDPEKFEFKDDNNLMDVITDNCIVLCEDTRVKNFLASQIEDICDGKHQGEDGYTYYVGDDEDTPEPKITNMMTYLPTTWLTIDNEQKIILTVEAPFILTATSAEDIWFAQRNNEGKIAIYPFRVFKGYKETWNEGIEKVYKNTINGRYCCCVYKPFSWDEVE